MSLFKLTHYPKEAEDRRGVNLISDALPFGPLWYEQAPEAISKDWATRLR